MHCYVISHGANPTWNAKHEPEVEEKFMLRYTHVCCMIPISLPEKRQVLEAVNGTVAAVQRWATSLVALVIVLFLVAILFFFRLL